MRRLFCAILILCSSLVSAQTLILKPRAVCGKGPYDVDDFFFSVGREDFPQHVPLQFPEGFDASTPSVIPLSFMQKYLHQALGGTPEALETVENFSGERIVVLPDSLSTKEQYFSEKICTFLIDTLTDGETRISVSILDAIPLDLFEEGDPLTFSFLDANASGQRVPRSFIRVSCASVLKAVSFSVSCRLKFFKEAFVPEGLVAAGTTLSEARLQVEEVEYKPEQGEFLPLEAVLSLFETRYTLTGGNPVRLKDVKRKNLVEAGKPVTIVYERSGIVMRMNGYAGLSGSAGDRIPVTPDISGKRIFATVVGVGEVAFEYR